MRLLKKRWTRWRQDNVTSFAGETFVGETRELLDETDPDANLSAAVSPDEEDSKITKLQDWEEWSRRGYMDLLTGMSFGGSAESAAEDTRYMNETVGDRMLLYTASYAPFSGFSPEVMVEQSEANWRTGAEDIALFAYNQLTDEQADALADGPFREPAIVSHSAPAMAAATGVRDLRERARSDYLEVGCAEPRLARPLAARLGVGLALNRVESGRTPTELECYRDLVAHDRQR